MLRGSKSRNSARLFDEFAAALQFPHYFGENWDALDECLADLEWLPGDAYLLFFTDSHRLLDHERDDKLGSLLDVLENAAREWARAKSRGPRDPPDRFTSFSNARNAKNPDFVNASITSDARCRS